MRQYQPIWERIKKHSYASLVAPIKNHKKIIKAVIKEKNMDSAYKFELSEKALTATLVINKDSKDASMIHFSLNVTIKTKYIGIEQL